MLLYLLQILFIALSAKMEHIVKNYNTLLDVIVLKITLGMDAVSSLRGLKYYVTCNTQNEQTILL